MVATPDSSDHPPSPALPTSPPPTSLGHESTVEISFALPDTRLDETQTPGTPITAEKEKQLDYATEGPPPMSSPIQFIGINYAPPDSRDIQPASQPRPSNRDPTPWESGAASPLSEDYVVIGVSAFPPKPCVVLLECPFYANPRLTLERSNGQAIRGGVPVSSYRFGSVRDSVFSAPPTGRIGVHHPREIVRVERDYTGGEIVQFSSAYPMELEGRVSIPIPIIFIHFLLGQASC